jgi:NTP pyrophosphatase (non-canonical NTP hydrolase)
MLQTAEAHNAQLTGQIDIDAREALTAKYQMQLDALAKQIHEQVGMGMNAYQTAAIKTARYPTDMKIIYPTLGVCGEAGELAEKIKKWIRDDRSEMSAERLALIKKEIGDVLWYLAALAHDLGLTLDEVAKHNIEKLASRNERNQIHGDGDTR